MRAPSRSPAIRRALCALAALALPAAVPLRAQEPRPALAVTVVDADTREPLPRARAALLDGPAGITDDSGVLRIPGLAEGTWVLEVSHLGHATRRVLARVPAGGAATLQVALAPAPIAIAGIATRAGPATRNRHLLGFYARASSGGGQYFTRAEIERVNPAHVSDLFRMVPGMMLVSTSLGDRPQMEGGQVGAAKQDAGVSALAGGGPQRGAGACPILYFLDGTPVDALQGVIAAEVDVREVEGIEIYRRMAVAPPQFRRPGDYCGVIVIWKRDRIVGRGVRDDVPAAKRPPPPAQQGH
ncbi:MAG: TonB-dependent receptor plug [Gemmatimonadetes bacterium]|nr:TonB-dependent receptor plug [Gemmatimonadota bacterium]